jgi:GTP 3',8-cyclase
LSLRKGSGSPDGSTRLIQLQPRPASLRDRPRRADGLEVVELEVGSRCNRSCHYCPVSLNPRPNVPVWMSDRVFQGTVDQLADLSFAGRISYHLYNEPLLRKDMARLVAIVDERLPDALQILNTNGDFLDDERYEKLRAAGLDYFYVTRHSPGEYPERPFQVLQTWEDLTLTNRGGTMTHLPSASETVTHTPCHAPSEMLIVSVTGDVLLCYEDAHRTHVMGNVLREHVADIWTSDRFREYRERLERGDRSVDQMCLECTNVSHRRPHLSALETPVLDANELTRRDEDAVAVLKRRSRAARAARRTGPS